MDVQICWKKAGVVENFSDPVGQDMGPALLYRPGAVLIPVSWGKKQLLEKKKDLAKKPIASLCLGITWSLEVLNRINSWNKTVSPAVYWLLVRTAFKSQNQAFAVCDTHFLLISAFGPHIAKEVASLICENSSAYPTSCSRNPLCHNEWLLWKRLPQDFILSFLLIKFFSASFL